MIAAVNQPGLIASGDVEKFLDAAKPVGSDGLAGPAFDRQQTAVFFDEEVDFLAVAVAPEVDVLVLAAVKPPFEHFADHQILEQRPTQVAEGEFLGISDVGQPRGQRGVEKV